MTATTPTGYTLTVPEEQSKTLISRFITQIGEETPTYLGRWREGPMNAIEACLRAKELYEDPEDYLPTVYLGPNISRPNLSCIADNGDGMSLDTIRNHLATILNSISAMKSADKGDKLSDANKGIGVKTALLTQNPGGLEFSSLQKGADYAYRIKLIISPDREVQQAYLDTDQGQATIEYIPKDEWEGMKFEHIKDAGHGTIVTMFGSDYTGSSITTVYPEVLPEGVSKLSDHQPRRYFNRRFYHTYGVKVVFAGVTGKADEVSKEVLPGMQAYLNEAILQGAVTVPLPGGIHQAPLNWYVLPKGLDDTSENLYGHKNLSYCGFFSIKYCGELYQLKPLAKAGTFQSELSDFGIYAGANQTFLILDLDALPKEVLDEYLGTDMVRKCVYYKHENVTDRGLSGSDFTAAFATAIRDKDTGVIDLLDFMQAQQVKSANSKDHDKRLRDFMKEHSLSLRIPNESKSGMSDGSETLVTNNPDDTPEPYKPTSDIPVKREPKPRFVRNKQVSDGKEPQFVVKDETYSDDSQILAKYNKYSNVVEIFKKSTRFVAIVNTILTRLVKEAPHISPSQFAEVVDNEVLYIIKQNTVDFLASEEKLADELDISEDHTLSYIGAVPLTAAAQLKFEQIRAVVAHIKSKNGIRKS